MRFLFTNQARTSMRRRPGEGTFYFICPSEVRRAGTFVAVVRPQISHILVIMKMICHLSKYLFTAKMKIYMGKQTNRLIRLIAAL